jgi:copper ion binding protein
MQQRVFGVSGMTCSHCVTAVREEVASIPGVSAVEVDLDGGTVTVQADGEIDVTAVRGAVEEAGYQLAG